MEELYNKLKGLDKNTLQVLILLLMEDRIIEYSDITEAYVQHLQSLYKGCSDAYNRLQGMVMTMWCDHKKNRTENLKDIMRLLVEEGRVNMTLEQIDKHK
jgi:hypothetical protein